MDTSYEEISKRLKEILGEQNKDLHFELMPFLLDIQMKAKQEGLIEMYNGAMEILKRRG